MKWYEDPEYQLMCEKAVKIQKVARKNPPTTGACLLRHLGQSPVCVDEHGRFFLNDRENRIYLPSQEDLQEIYEQHLQKRCDIGEYKFNVAYTFTVLEEFLKTFFNLVTADRIREEWYPKSWVQFWLAFVYHELYQKKWNPEKKEWEEIK